MQAVQIISISYSWSNFQAEPEMITGAPQAEQRAVATVLSLSIELSGADIKYNAIPYLLQPTKNNKTSNHKQAGPYTRAITIVRIMILTMIMVSDLCSIYYPLSRQYSFIAVKVHLVIVPFLPAYPPFHKTKY